MPEPEDTQIPKSVNESNSAPPVQDPEPFVAYKNAQTEKPPVGNLPPAPWFIALAGLALFEVGIGFFLLKGARSVPNALGIGLAIAAAAAVLFLAILGRKAKFGWNVGAVPVLLIAMYLGAVPGFVVNKAQDRKDRQDMSKSLANDLGHFVDESSGNDLKKLDKLDTSKKGAGAWGDIDSFIKKLTNDVIEIRNGYLSDLDAIKWNTILEPNRLLKDKNMSESYSMIKAAAESVKKRRQQTLDVMSKSVAKAEKMDASHKDIRDFVAGYKSNYSKTCQQSSKMWGLEGQTIEEFKGIIDLLAQSPRRWMIEDGQVVFDNDEDVEAFNTHMQRIEDITKEQQQMQKQSAAKMRQGLDMLGR